MMQPLVLTACDFDDVEHVRRMLDALRDARSWTCDQRSQIPCLRFVGADGLGRIVAMEGAEIHPGDTRCRMDGDRHVADALRDAAIVCLRRALLPPHAGQVEEARERFEAYAAVVAVQTDCGVVHDECVVTAATPWSRANVHTYHSPHGVPTLKDAVPAPDADLCPIMFGVTEGDSGRMKDMSICLSVSIETRSCTIDMMEALRAGEMLRHRWRNH
jgi:hypothetical protein